MADYTMKQHDTTPPLDAVLSDENGVVDLTDAATVTVILKSATVTVTGLCTITDAPAGAVEYVWDTGDTDVAGSYEGEFEVVWTDTTIETFPNDSYFGFVIKEDLG